jgi:hypothetical protein
VGVLEAHELLAGLERVAQHQHQADHGQRQAHRARQRRDHDPAGNQHQAHDHQGDAQHAGHDLPGEIISGRKARARHGEDDRHNHGG